MMTNMENNTSILIDALDHINMVGPHTDLVCRWHSQHTQDIEWSDADSQMWANVDLDLASVECDSCREQRLDYARECANEAHDSPGFSYGEDGGQQW
tara:strand:- start:11198 stop:11488 length:291 start_codon:yes stop_codon:yes gene_type:complete